MSFTFVQEPTTSTDQIAFSNWTPIVGWTLYRSDNNYLNGKFYYKLALVITSGNQSPYETHGTLKQRPNGYGPDLSNERARAIFDVRDIVNSILVDTVIDQNCTGIPFGSIHELGANEYECGSDSTPCFPIYSHNGNRDGYYQINRINVTGREWYSDNSYTMPSQATDSVSDTRWFIKASMPVTTARGTDPYAFQNSEELEKYLPISTADGGLGEDVQFLSDQKKQNWNNVTGYFPSGTSNNTGARLTDEYINWVRSSDYHTLAFINTNYSGPECDLDYMKIILYKGDGTLIYQGDLANRNAGVNLYGGSQPTAQDANTPPDEMLLYFGCGPKNLDAQYIDVLLKPCANPNKDWQYYSVQGYNSSAAVVTAKYWFVRQRTDCKSFVPVRLGWVNSKGAYDYYNFTKKSSFTTDITRTHYETMMGTYDKSVYRYNDTDRGKSVNKVTAITKQTLQTGWISEQDGWLIENLLLSRNVFTIRNLVTNICEEPDYTGMDFGTATTQPVLVTDKSFKKKTTINDGIKIQYTIKIEFAQSVNTNS